MQRNSIFLLSLSLSLSLHGALGRHGTLGSDLYAIIRTRSNITSEKCDILYYGLRISTNNNDT
jgi:hypothetical protein